MSRRYDATGRRPVAAQARVLAAVRQGAQVRDAMRAEYYAPRTVDIWRKRYPDFAAALDQARRDARAMNPHKTALLSAMMAGLPMPKAAAVVGVSKSAATNWRRNDPWFAEQYGRLVAARRSERAQKRERFFAALSCGMTAREACRVAGYCAQAPYVWRRYWPEGWRRYVAIMERMRP